RVLRAVPRTVEKGSGEYGSLSVADGESRSGSGDTGLRSNMRISDLTPFHQRTPPGSVPASIAQRGSRWSMGLAIVPILALISSVLACNLPPGIPVTPTLIPTVAVSPTLVFTATTVALLPSRTTTNTFTPTVTPLPPSATHTLTPSETPVVILTNT